MTDAPKPPTAPAMATAQTIGTLTAAPPEPKYVRIKLSGVIIRKLASKGIGRNAEIGPMGGYVSYEVPEGMVAELAKPPPPPVKKPAKKPVSVPPPPTPLEMAQALGQRKAQK